MKTRKEIVDFFSELGLGRVAKKLVDILQACIRLEFVTDEFEQGHSFLGGLPELPKGFEWPEIDGRPLCFVGQLNIPELQTNDIWLPKPFPTLNILSFFVHPEFGPELVANSKACRVFHFESDSLSHPKIPDGLERQTPPTHVKLEADLIMSESTGFRVRPLNLTEDERKILDDMDDDDGFPRHHLFGAAMSSVLDENQFDLIFEKFDSEGYQLLFQCDSDPRINQIWGENGRLFFLIPKQDLEASRFDRVILIWQDSPSREFPDLERQAEEEEAPIPSRSLGVHFALSAQDAKRLLKYEDPDELVEFITEDLEERYLNDDKWSFQSDKAWDAIHRSITDGQLVCESGPFPLAYAILGGQSLDSGDDYVACFVDSDRVVDVDNALTKISREWMRERYLALEHTDYGPISDEDFEYTWENFEGLRAFFSKAAKARRPVLFTTDE